MTAAMEFRGTAHSSQLKNLTTHSFVIMSVEKRLITVNINHRGAKGAVKNSFARIPDPWPAYQQAGPGWT